MFNMQYGSAGTLNFYWLRAKMIYMYIIQTDAHTTLSKLYMLNLAAV